MITPRMCKRLPGLLLKLSLLLAVAACSDTSEVSTDSAAMTSTPDPVKIRAVVVTMFEIGEDSGDQAGEFQLWNERRNLTEVYEFGGHHSLHHDPESGLMVMVTGIGTAKSAASVMMLGMDPRFDVSEAYWLVAGISGFDPQDASIGSAAWAEYLVDGDLSHEIDAREIPDDWDYGYFARYTRGPFDPERPEPTGEMFRLNPALTDWAFRLTQDMELPDDEALAETRALYTEHPNAQRPPFVLKGDHLAALTFWHGEILNNWANDWVDYWTDGEGEFVSSAMEDTGTLQAITYLDNAGRADRDRVMVLRTASNYTMPPPGVTAAENLLAENEGYAGLDASLESAYLVGSRVIDTLLENWETYRERTPTADDLQSSE
ncbi:purine nucleoside permease [Chromatocurvus halotolerans]|uniref:Purine nucleoside permease n=1 Tax=Chromatocurvus halotolerans TaxID=1132028 RepID=A0A4R2KZG7_9GAMM|nr:purine nucleoside permease [Chromatocurvus halotolerans]TCO78602.1 purine nucleoside permease [Chromatocurvus halotolerans]